MLRSQTGASDREYLRAFERMNILDITEWSMTLARQRRPEILPKLVGREVVICGYDAYRALEFPPPPRPFLWKEVNGIRYCLLPHPSGLNRMYNDPATLITACLLLAELYTRSRRAHTVKRNPEVKDGNDNEASNSEVHGRGASDGDAEGEAR